MPLINLRSTYCRLNLMMLMIYVCWHRASSAFEFIVVQYGNTSHVVCNQSNPCTTLQPTLLELRNGSKLIIGAGDSYILSYDDAMTMYGMNSIAIVGEGSDNTVITCNSNSGLAFINMNDITIANLTLKECGAWMNSTTQNGTNNDTLRFRCGVYFLDCNNVTIYDVIVTDGPGTGVMIYDTLGTVTIANSQFIHNRVPTDDVNQVPGGGGVYIEFSHCKPNTTNFTACSPSVQANANYTIINSTFTDNNGSTIEEETTKYTFSTESGHQQFGRGGAMSVYFKGLSENNTINIINCHIAHNQAVWGAGLFVDVLDNAKNNRVIVKRVTFLHNFCSVDATTGGGAIRIHFFAQLHLPNNTITVSDSMFDSNTAYYGGGASMTTHQEKGVYNASNKVIFHNCTWHRNVARIGSAVDLSSSSFVDTLEGQLVAPVFDNCSFIQNSNSYTKNIAHSVGLGSLNSDDISMEFYNDTHFMENNGTALSVLNALVHFKHNSSAMFYRNKGFRGGAIALLGSTVLRTFPYTKLLFEENMATDKGGAIYIISLGVRDVSNTHKCFIQYHDNTVSPFEWETNFTIY